MIRTRQKKETAANPDAGHIKIRHIVFCIAMLFATLAMISHSATDWSAIKGGTNVPPQNWIGPLGAYFSHILLVSCGIAAYLLVIIFLLRSFRKLLPNAGSWRIFFGGTALVVSGTMLLLALTPGSFTAITNNLGIGHSEEPLKALSGGLIGQFFAAPPCEPEISAGCLVALIGSIGTMITGWILVTIGGVMLYVSDWHDLLRRFIFSPGGAAASRSLQNWAEKRAEKAAARAAAEEEYFEEEYEEDSNDDPDDYQPEEEPPPVSGKPVSRLSALLQAKEASGDDEYGDDNDNSSDELPLMDRPAQTAAADASDRRTTAAAMPAAVPGVGRHVVESGEKLRGCGGEFTLPLISMLAKGTNVVGENTDAIELAKNRIQQTLEEFSISGRVTGIVSGPRVTRYEITLAPGINVKKIEQIQDNIRMKLEATSIRVLAPIPGRSVVGIEVSNSKPEAVFMRSIMESEEWQNTKAEIPLALGKNVSGKPIVLDLAKAPHLLVAGTTGTGKSVCSNSLIISMLFRFSPDELRLIMVDPKIVEFEAYKKIPHLLTPIINDSAKVPIALRWAANEMDRRYRILAQAEVKKLSEYNSRPRGPEPLLDENGKPLPDKLPLLVIILDELADLMMSEAKKDVETNIARIAQKGRAAGIHIIVATQRPDVKIVTGVIKANLPTRLCFQVRSLIDSRVVLDAAGAEKLLGTGDMLSILPGSMELERIQGAWVKDEDIKNIVKFISDQAPQKFNEDVLVEDSGEEDIEDDLPIDAEDRADVAPLVRKYMRPGDDDVMRQALEVIIIDRKASTSYLQRRLRIGYNRAAELIEEMEKRGIVGPPSGSGNKRDIMIFDDIDY